MFLLQMYFSSPLNVYKILKSQTREKCMKIKSKVWFSYYLLILTYFSFL